MTGGIKAKEAPDKAFLRETQEETGLQVAVGPVIEVFDRIMLDETRRVQYHFVLVDYLCRPTGGVLAIARAARTRPTLFEWRANGQGGGRWVGAADPRSEGAAVGE